MFYIEIKYKTKPLNVSYLLTSSEELRVVIMELVEIVSSEKVDNKKVEKEVEKGKYDEDLSVINSNKKVIENEN